MKNLKFNRVKVTSVLCLALFLSACGNSVDYGETKDAEEAGYNMKLKVSDVQNIDPYSFEELASNRTYEDTETLLYNKLKDTVTIDTGRLLKLDSADYADTLKSVEKVVKQINIDLMNGENSGFLEDSVLNYMLLKFANTPYMWKMKEIVPVGVDPQTGIYFVDVTYTTDKSQYKTLIPDSIIVRGSENYDELRKKRFDDYVIYMDDMIREKDDPEDLPYGPMNPNSSWSKLIREEVAAANSIESFLTSINDTGVVIMDGYEEDAEQTTDEIVNEKVQEAEDKFYIRGSDGELYTKFSFEDRWGSIDEIMNSQEGMTLAQRVRRTNAQTINNTNMMNMDTPEDGSNFTNEPDIVSIFDDNVSEDTIQTYLDKGLIGACTYTGLTEVAADHGATMTFRFLLKDSYNLSLSNALKVQSVYLLDYELDDIDNLKDKYRTDTVLSVDVLRPYIETTIRSYRKCIDETNHIGLNSLFEAYGKYDNYYDDISNYSYITSGGYSVDIIGRKGNEFAVIVQQQIKERAKGTYMTFPTYLNTSLVKLKLCDDDKMRIISVTELSNSCIGEPVSVIKEVSGISEQIAFSSGDFTAINQAAVEKVIQDFENLQINYNGKFDPTTTYKTIDIGLSNTSSSNIASLFKAVQDIQATKVSAYVLGYNNKSNRYVNVKLREVFSGGTKNWDTESELGLMFSNDAWYVISYNRSLAVETSREADNDSSTLVYIDKSAGVNELHSKVGDVTGQVGGLVVSDAEDTGEGWDDVAYTTAVVTEPEVVTDENGNVVTEVDENNIPTS